MSIKTNITGNLYKSDGTAITSGKLITSLSSAFTSIDGYLVQPFRYEYTVTGLLDFDLFATENTVNGSSYTAMAYNKDRVYTIEYDPTPDVNTMLSSKDGYFRFVLSVPHVSDTPANNIYAFSSTGTPPKTKITGALYKNTGVKITTGNFTIKPTKAFIGIDGSVVAPFTITYAITGDLLFYLFATENTVGGSSYSDPDPLGVRYIIEFDPDPTTTTTTLTRKDGYFKNTISVPHVSDTAGSNIKDIQYIYSNESSSLSKKYGRGNILDNNSALLTAAQKSILVSSLGSANVLHAHSGTNLSYLKFQDQDGAIANPSADHIKLFYTKEPQIVGIGLIQDTGITQYGGFNLLLENGERVYLYLESIA